MQWVYDNHKKRNIRVVCMSFGSEPLGYNDPIMSGAEELWKNGIVVVAAAGNSGPEFQTIKSPGVSSRIITVGGFDDNRISAEDFNEKFFEGYYQVPIMILGSIFSVIVSLISVIYIAKKNTKIVANTSIVSAIINIVVHLLLIKFVGLFAATMSTFTAYFVMSVYRLHDLKKKYFEIKIDRTFIISTVLVLIPILIAFYSNNMILYVIGLAIAVVYAYVINRKDLNKIFKMILKRK